GEFFSSDAVTKNARRMRLPFKACRGCFPLTTNAWPDSVHRSPLFGLRPARGDTARADFVVDSIDPFEPSATAAAWETIVFVVVFGRGLGEDSRAREQFAPPVL